MTLKSASQPFAANAVPRSASSPPKSFSAVAVLEKLPAFSALGRRYDQISRTPGNANFFDRVLDHFNIRYRIEGGGLDAIPKVGPLVVVANHPFGGVEGVVLASLLLRVRSDVRILANSLLSRFPEFNTNMIFVDPFAGPSATKANVAPLRESLAWLKSGGVLGIFPAGTVSRLDLRRGEIADSEWNATAARLVRKTGAGVVPVFFAGGNGPLFQMAGLIHPNLRTALLPREFLNKENHTFEARVGGLLAANRLATIERDEDLTAYLRSRTYLLGRRLEKPAPPAFFIRRPDPPTPKAIRAAVPSEKLAAEVAELPANRLLAESGALAVYQSESRRIPMLVEEIGRLREITFRETGEGTGKSTDLDRFDTYYTHLFVWNRETSEIVGAYRFGKTDEIVERFGVKGLYTRTLFDYKLDLLERLGPSLELGRSFVRREHQKSFSPLLLLWKGIGAFVARNPRYGNLFGPVSVSNDYETVSRQLLVSFLKTHDFTNDLAQLVKARNPFRDTAKYREATTAAALLTDIDDLSNLIADLEADRKGVPVLLRQYLKLGGKLLGFNIDPHFNGALDGLILVDLRRTERRMLDRYLGSEGAAGFLAFHAAQRPACPQSTGAD